MQEKLKELVADLKGEEALKLVKEMLNNGENPMVVLEICRKALEIVGKRFEDGKCYIPNLLMSGEIMLCVSERSLNHIFLQVQRKRSVARCSLEQFGEIYMISVKI